MAAESSSAWHLAPAGRVSGHWHCPSLRTFGYAQVAHLPLAATVPAGHGTQRFVRAPPASRKGAPCTSASTTTELAAPASHAQSPRAASNAAGVQAGPSPPA